MKETEKSYWAGFIDGEGSIIISTTKGVHFLRVMIYQKNSMICKEAMKSFGFGSIYSTKKGKSIIKGIEYHTGGMNCWHTSSNKAEEVIKIILPYLKIKKKQAEIALEFQEYKRKSNMQGKRRNAGFGEILDEVKERKEEYKNQISLLNKT